LARVKRSVRALGALGGVVRGIEAHENELRESRAALAISRNEMKQLIERLPDGVLIHRERIVRWVNSAMVEILGLERPEDVVGRSILELVAPEEQEALAGTVQRAIRDATSPHTEHSALRPTDRDGASSAVSRNRSSSTAKTCGWWCSVTSPKRGECASRRRSRIASRHWARSPPAWGTKSITHLPTCD
jgi:PAS domain S-box-containing protein